MAYTEVIVTQNILLTNDYLIVAFFLTLLFVNYFILKKIYIQNKEYIKNEIEINLEIKQFQKIMLIFGILSPIIELFSYSIGINRSGINLSNIIIGVFLLVIYGLSVKSKIVKENLRPVFATMVILFTIKSLLKIYYYEPYDLSIFLDFCIIYTVAKNIFNLNTKNAIFNILLQSSLSYLFLIKKIPLELFFALSTALILISVINHIRQTTYFNTRNKYLFTNEIVNNSNNLTIATNRKGEVIFCSKNVKTILGYNSNEVMGLEFWRLTEDPEFKGEAYHENYIDNRTYVRMLKAKNGEVKLIEWNDKMYNQDLFVGIGSDITYQNSIENQYKELVEKATDLIYEIDNQGYFTFVNNYFLELLEYSLEDLRSIYFLEIIDQEFREKVIATYQKEKLIGNEFPILEFSVKTKSGKTLWASQKVTLKRDLNGKVIGYSAIARDITALRELEISQKNRELKSERFNKTLIKLAKFHFETEVSHSNFMEQIVQESAKALQIKQVSFWEFENNLLVCKNLLNHENYTIPDDFSIDLQKIPKYLNIIIKKGISVIDNLEKADFYEEFKAYKDETDVKSMLDMCIVINNKTHGILCFESIGILKKWDDLDIGFVRSVAEITTTLIESQKRKEAEKLLKYKTEILSAITQNTEKILKGKNTQEIFENVIGNIGTIINVDRIYYYEIDEIENKIIRKYDWNSQKTTNEIEDAKVVDYHLYDDLLTYLNKHRLYEGLVEKMPSSLLKNILQIKNVKSILFIAVFIKGKLKGFVGFSDCTENRYWSKDESTILQTLVENFAAAIERNINEQIILESEERFRLLANNIPGAVYLSKNDQKWSKIYVNDKIEELTGYPKEDFLENKIYFIDLVEEEDIQSIVNVQKDSLTNKKSFNIKYRIKHKNGHIVWIEEYGDAVYKNGEVLYIEGVFMDITEKISQENAIKEKELAEASNQSKSIFLANMSHEIRTPLNGIIGFTELLKETNLTEEQREYIKTIRFSSQMLMVIVNDILDFSKIESGKYKIVNEPLEITPTCQKVIEAIRYEALKKGLKIHTFIDENIPEVVLADSIRLKQILINLLSNAVKFTNEGDVTLSVNLKRSLIKDKKRIRFSVTDTGIGIKKENLTKIFEAFSQADNSTTRQFGGTGLGLNISNKILNLIDSQLKLKSVYGVGSVFYFDLHLDEVSKTIINQDVQFQNVFNLNKRIKSHLTKETHILLIEDNRINMLLIKTMVKKLIPGAIIHEAFDGEEGVKAFKKNQPDLILMDIQMPIMNGYESTEKIRALEISSRTPIIALTAGIVSDERKKCFEAGMDDFLSKPINKDILEFTIVKWLNQ